jgi:D-sedoheptulose 7-phosphate isomerase
MINKIKSLINESITVKTDLLSDKEVLGDIKTAIEWMLKAVKNGHKVILFGNGGSASDAQHMAGELVGRFKKERKGYPVIMLGTNISTLTAISNDYNFEMIYEREIEAIGNPGDVAMGISTSGNALNVIKAIKKAEKMKLKTISLTGGNGGELARQSQLSLIMPSSDTPRIQEAHITVIHIMCELIEKDLM